MNMRISGRGNIPSGEYDNVTVRGGGHLFGKVRCLSFSASGTCKGEEIECTHGFKSAGKASFSGDIKAKSIRASGSLSCGADITSDGKLTVRGSAKCKKSIKCEQLSVSGSLSVGGDIEAESVKTAGAVNCEGLLNAESIEITADKKMNIASIGGSNILIKRKRISLFFNRGVAVTTAIEGDNMVLEYVTCPRVTGRNVVIGKGCEIEHVQCSGKVKISPKAKVLKTEKI